MKTGKPIFIFLAMILILFSVMSISCFGEVKQYSALSGDKLSALLVPDTNLELYVYAKQERPTIIPAEVADLPRDVAVNALAIWGLPSDQGMVFGAGLTFASNDDASRIFSELKLENNIWKILKDNRIYVVNGSSTAAESLKSAISNNNFKYYTNGAILDSVSILPRGGSTKLVAIAVAKPSKQVLEFAKSYLTAENYVQMERVMKSLSVEAIIGGFYSPHQINIARVIELFRNKGSISTLEAGTLTIIKSGLPGFVMEPIVKSMLIDYGFKETVRNDFVIYEKVMSFEGENEIPVLLRVEGNYLFIAASGDGSYAQLLLTSVYK